MLRAVAATVAVVAFAMTTGTASASPLDDCAQRVIRDWYSGGRVDGVYPLPCYRAAIKALPADVLQYSDADREIASALAYAREGRRNDARPVREQPKAERDATSEPKPKRRPASADAPRQPDAPARLASGPEAGASESVPYPIVALAALAGVLVLSAAAGWLARRRY